MERVVASADLLSMILNEADKNTQAKCARVCRSWFDPALRNLWNSMDNIIYLLRLLPRVIYDGKVVGYEPKTSSDWERFDIYKVFIRKLVLKCAKANVVHDTLRTLAYTNSVTTMLPNLVDMTIHSGPCVLDSLFFIHKGLQNITILDILDASMHNVLKHLLQRMTNVRSLKMVFTGEIEATKYGQIFREGFQGMARLEKLILSNLHITGDMIQCLAALPELKEFSYISPNAVPASVSKGQPAIAPISSVKAKDIQLSCLENVTLETTTHIISQFLNFGHDLSNMRRLELTFTDVASEASLRKVCEKLALEWYSISDLSIKLNVEIMNGEENITLKYDTFCHLSSLRQMEYFDFYYATPLVIDYDQMAELLQNWPQLIKFSIRSDPNFAYDETPSLTLNVLQLFSTHCKNLRQLRLYVDAIEFDEEEHDPAESILENLESITFDFSPIADEEAVAVYISQFCNPLSEMILEEVKLGPATNEADTGRIKEMEGYKEMWKGVSKSLGTILRVLERERRFTASRESDSQTISDS